MKKTFFIIVAFLILQTSASVCQNTFNKRIHFGFPATTFTSIEVTDSCYYLSGIVADSIYPYRTGTFFARFNFDGEVVFAKTLKDTAKSYEAWQNTLTPLEDGNFILSGYSFDENMKGLLMKFTPEGDTLFVKKYESPYILENSFIRNEDCISLSDKGFAFLNSIEKANFDNNILLIRTDSLGQVLWQKVYGGPEDEVAQSLIATDDGGIIIGAQLVSTFGRTYLIKVDSVGEVEWEYLTPNNITRGSAKDMHLLDDGSLIGLNSEGVQISPSAVFWNSMVFKLNENQGQEWETRFADSFPSFPIAFLEKILPLPGNQHFLAAGSGYGLVNEEWQYLGKLIKASYEGDSIWTRYYHHVENHLAQNLLYDLEATPDGGFIMCGQAQDTDPMPTVPNQQGWLLKVDQHGCLVPGCHLTSSTTNEQPPVPFQLKLYPNPASDYLNIYFRHERAGLKGQFRIINTSGILQQQFDSGWSDVTHIVDLQRYSVGVYYLQYLEDGVLMRSAGFEVQR